MTTPKTCDVCGKPVRLGQSEDYPGNPVFTHGECAKARYEQAQREKGETQMPIVTDTYRVFSYERSPNPPNHVDSSLWKLPAGEYEKLEDAIRHAESVTYGMHVLNRQGKVVYDSPPE
jgi:hypothetical protein